MNTDSILVNIDHLVVDLCCYEDPDVYTLYYFDNLLSDSFIKLLEETMKPSVRRYVLPLNPSRRVSHDYDCSCEPIIQLMLMHVLC